MKKFNRLMIVIFSLFVFVTLTSCGKSNKDDKINYVKLNSEVVSTNDTTKTISVISENNAFKNSITTNDIIVYDITLATETGYYYSEYNNDLSQYLKDNKEIIDKFGIEKTNLVYVNEKQITFDIEVDSKCLYGFIINPDKIKNNKYGFGFIPNTISGNMDIQTQFEDAIIEGVNGWKIANTVINVAGGIASIIIGAVTGQPVAISGGIVTILSSLGGAFFGDNGPSISDVMNRLDEVEAKIDKISHTIDLNQQELMDNLARQEAMIDELLLNQYTQNITYYNTSNVNPVETFKISYKDKVEQKIKTYVNEVHTIDVYHNNKGELVYDTDSTAQEIQTYTKTSYQVNNFTNAINNITKNNNIVTDEFPKEIKKDITASLDSSVSSKDKVSQEIYLTLMDDIAKEVASDSSLHDTVVTLMANTKFLCQAISGKNGDSILNSYSGRLKHIYNFGIEYKPVSRQMLASIRLGLDEYYNLAQEACIAQGINCKDMGEAYLDACNKIKTFYESEQKIADGYSFAANKQIKGDLVGAYCNTYYTNPGNDCEFHAQIVFKNNITVTIPQAAITEGTNINLSNLNLIDQNLYKSLGRRYQIQKSMGLTSYETFSEYILKINFFDSRYKQFQYLYQANVVSENAYFLLSMDQRDLTANDTGMRLHCQAVGNPDGYYFNKVYSYGYRQEHSADCWSGKMTYGTFIEGVTGTNLVTNRDVITYARYDESHWYWIDDEHYSFVSYDVGNFFYVFYY